MKQSKSNQAGFSVALGLFDYINPLLYAVTTITLLFRLPMSQPLFILFLVGVLLSLFFGLAIPTVKLMVGLGRMRFRMPVNLVFFVNLGILLAGLSLLATVTGLKPSILCWILAAFIVLLTVIKLLHGRFNTIAVLAGAFGYLLIYISLILYALTVGSSVSVVLYSVAICLYLSLIVTGIKADLMKPRVHWFIEITNVLCQLLVALGTVLAFLR